MASGALSDLVVWAVEEKKRALFGAQDTRASTIEMAQSSVTEHDGIFGRDHSGALRACPLLLIHHQRPFRAARVAWLVAAMRNLGPPRPPATRYIPEFAEDNT